MVRLYLLLTMTFVSTLMGSDAVAVEPTVAISGRASVGGRTRQYTVPRARNEGDPANVVLEHLDAVILGLTRRLEERAVAVVPTSGATEGPERLALAFELWYEHPLDQPSAPQVLFAHIGCVVGESQRNQAVILAHALPLNEAGNVPGAKPSRRARAQAEQYALSDENRTALIDAGRAMADALWTPRTIHAGRAVAGGHDPMEAAYEAMVATSDRAPSRAWGLPVAVSSGRLLNQQSFGTYLHGHMLAALSDQGLQILMSSNPNLRFMPEHFPNLPILHLKVEPPSSNVQDGAVVQLSLIAGRQSFALFSLPIDLPPETWNDPREGLVTLAQVTAREVASEVRVHRAFQHIASTGSLRGIAQAMVQPGAGERVAQRPTSGWPSIDGPLPVGVPPSDDVAVVVGLEEYAFLPDAPHAQRDAEAFRALATSGLGVAPERVWHVKTGSDVHVKQALEQALAALPRGGRLWFYFAGHAAPDPAGNEIFLLGDDTRADPTMFATRGVALRAIEAMIEERQANAVLIVDAGTGGAGRGGADLLGGTRFLVPTWATEDRQGSISRWIAATDRAPAVIDDVGHGAFSYLVIGALRGWASGGGGDGVVSPADVRRFVERMAVEKGLDLRPSWAGDDDAFSIPAREPWQGQP